MQQDLLEVLRVLSDLPHGVEVKPDLERLQSDGTMEDLAKRVMDAGKPDDWDDEGEGNS